MKRILAVLLVICLSGQAGAAEVINSAASNPVVPYGDYFNFGTKIGSSGYGFRTNNGIIEVKNLSGSWATLGDNVSGIVDIVNGGTGTNTATLLGAYTVLGTSLTDLPVYDTEFLSENGWTSTGWTGNWAAGWTHTTGNTSVLSQSTAAVSSTKYQITYTVTNRTAGSFTLAFGGQIFANISATGEVGPISTTTGNLTVTPTSTFDGTIVLSIKAITAGSTSLLTFASSDRIPRVELRANKLLGNTYLGLASGGYSSSAIYNAGGGYYALPVCTSGSWNSTFGPLSAYSLTVGSGNSYFGYASGYSNIGGNYNTSGGALSLYSNIYGNYNLGCGVYSGRYIADGVTANTFCTGAVYLGYNTKALANGATNEIVIGYNASGFGTNTATLGSSNVTSTILRGNVLLHESYTDASNYARLKTTVDSSSYRFAIDQLGTGIANRPFVFLQTSSASGTGWDFQTGTGTSKIRWDVNGKEFRGVVGDSTASPGNATINTVTGKSAIAAGQTAMTLTNSNIASTSMIFISPLDTDATALAWKYSAGTGVGTITVNAAATATWKFAWKIIN